MKQTILYQVWMRTTDKDVWKIAQGWDVFETFADAQRATEIYKDLYDAHRSGVQFRIQQLIMFEVE